MHFKKTALALGIIVGTSFLVACGGDSNNRGNGGDAGGQVPTELGFAAVPRSLEDRVVLPEGTEPGQLVTIRPTQIIEGMLA